MTDGTLFVDPGTSCALALWIGKSVYTDAVSGIDPLNMRMKRSILLRLCERAEIDPRAVSLVVETPIQKTGSVWVTIRHKVTWEAAGYEGGFMVSTNDITANQWQTRWKNPSDSSESLLAWIPDPGTGKKKHPGSEILKLRAALILQDPTCEMQHVRIGKSPWDNVPDAVLGGLHEHLRRHPDLFGQIPMAVRYYRQRSNTKAKKSGKTRD